MNTTIPEKTASDLLLVRNIGKSLLMDPTIIEFVTDDRNDLRLIRVVFEEAGTDVPDLPAVVAAN